MPHNPSRTLDKGALWARAQELGMEMLGIASMDRFDVIAPAGHPASILPEARSVIVVGVSVPRGQYIGTEVGTQWQNADQRVGARGLLALCRFIEKSGWEAVPVLPKKANYYPKTRPVAAGRPVPNVVPSLTYAAVAAGLGEIGYCGLVMTPAFGSRQSLGMIVTEAEYEPDPIFEGTVCDREHCRECAKICPSHAISMDKTIMVDICGKKMLLADINYDLCRMCQNGAAPDFSYQTGSEELMPDMIGNQPTIENVSSVLSRKSVPNIQMALCNRTCIAHMDDAPALEHKHIHRFRTQAPWKLEIWER